MNMNMSKFFVALIYNKKMSKKSSYCGIGEVPSGAKRGTMKECVMKNQVRYYGKAKLTEKVLEDVEIAKYEIKELKTKHSKLYKRYIALSGTIAGIKRRFKFAKKQVDKDELKEQGLELIREKNHIVDEYKAVEKKLKKYENFDDDD